MFAKYLKAAYKIEGINSPREKKRVRDFIYRMEPDWDKRKDPALAVAFGILNLCKIDKKTPGWIIGYQHDACALANRIDDVLK